MFNNATLAAIATARPRSRSALRDLPGVGPVKVERYGDAVLALVGEHAGARSGGLQSAPSQLTPRPRGER